jgi:hypothetical protein
VHGRDGAPEYGVVIGRCNDGARFIARLPHDSDVLEAFGTSEAIGARGLLHHTEEGGTFAPR